MELNPSKTAFVFPGQGSQAVGMGQDLSAAHPIARATFVLADTLLGFQLSEIAWEGPEDVLTDTINTQPALLIHSIAALRVFQDKLPDFKPKYVAGHSLGELSALVASGALEFAPALSLTRRRGELMKRAGQENPGGMVALLGLDIKTVDQICDQASDEEEQVQVANDNCSGQIVVSGAGGALRRLMTLAKEAGARKVVPLMVSIAAHSYLMSSIQEDFDKAVDNSGLKDPATTIIGNVNARELTRARDIEDDVKGQLTSRVRWTESVEYMVSQGVDTFIEFGTGDVLSKLIRRIDRNATRLTFGTADDVSKFFA